MNEFPQIFTFYSFKGGVGRSMAVLNLAYALAAKARNVLVLDMDLEAPGLSGFLRRREKIGDCARQDMVDLVRWARDCCQLSQQTGAPVDAASYPPLNDFAVRVPPEMLQAMPGGLGQFGRVDIIPVDEQRDYYGRLEALAIQQLDQEALIRVGSLLRAWLKSRQFSLDVPEYYGPNAERAAAYDYVLVDSRTGVTETGGLCIGPLSDQLVVLTALNDQNVEGTRRFLEEVGILAVQPTGEGDRAPKEARAQRLDPKPTLIVASPVPAGEIETKKRRLEALEKAVGQVVVRLSYHPQMALLESIFTRDYPDEYLAKEYATLLNDLLRAARDRTELDAKLLWDCLDFEKAEPSKRREILKRAARSASTTDETPLRLLLQRWDARGITEDEDFVLWDRACRLMSAADVPSRLDVTATWANVLSAWSLRPAPGDITLLRREAAMRCYREVIESDGASGSQKASALVNRGVTYGKLGDTEKAIADYTAVVEMPDAPAEQKAGALYNRGLTYGTLGESEKEIADYNAVVQMAGAPVGPRAQALFNRGRRYGKLGESEKETADYNAVVQMADAPAEPKAKALCNRGVNYGKLGDSEKEIADYTAVLEMADAPAEAKANALCNRAVAYGKLGDSEKEIADYAAVVEIPDAPAEQKATALVNRGWAHYAAGRHADAIKDHREGLALNPRNCAARGNLAIALLVDGQTNEALAAYDAALEIVTAEELTEMTADLNEALEKHGSLPGAEEALARITARRAALADSGSSAKRQGK